MRKTFVRLYLISLFVILLAFPVAVLARGLGQDGSPPTAPLTLPDYVPLLLAAGIGWVLTQGLKSLSVALPGVPNLEGQATAIVGALVTAFVAIANTLLALLPLEWQTPVALVFGTIGSILAAYGIAGTIKSFQPSKPVKSAK
jgi:hypothetical protein